MCASQTSSLILAFAADAASLTGWTCWERLWARLAALLCICLQCSTTCNILTAALYQHSTSLSKCLRLARWLNATEQEVHAEVVQPCYWLATVPALWHAAMRRQAGGLGGRPQAWSAGGAPRPYDANVWTFQQLTYTFNSCDELVHQGQCDIFVMLQLVTCSESHA